MSDTKNDKSTVETAETKHVPPANLPEELLPVYDWYMNKGKDHLLTAAIAFIAVIAVMAVIRYHDNRNAEASFALTGADGVESFEDLNGKYARTAVGPVISLRLAKAYFEAGNFSAATETYGSFLKKNRRHILAPQAKLGYAAALEADQKFAEAKDAYADLAKNEASPLYPEAVMGQARCLAASNDKAAATDLLDRLMIAKKDTRWESQAEALRGVIDRFEGFKANSVFDKLGTVEAPAAEATAEAPAAAPAEEAK